MVQIAKTCLHDVFRQICQHDVNIQDLSSLCYQVLVERTLLTLAKYSSRYCASSCSVRSRQSSSSSGRSDTSSFIALFSSSSEDRWLGPASLGELSGIKTHQITMYGVICAYIKYVFVNTHVHVFTGNQLYELFFGGIKVK